jgi:uncharacterized protein
MRSPAVLINWQTAGLRYVLPAIQSYGLHAAAVLASTGWRPYVSSGTRTKIKENQRKHGVAFAIAQFAFADPIRVIAEDLSHSSGEKRYYCFGRVDGGVLTVRFTYRDDAVRIFGAGYWRRGKTIYERENQIHG